MSVNQSQIVDYLKSLRLSEVKSLIATLEAELGVKAGQPTMLRPFDPGPAPPAVEPTAFDVLLSGYAPQAKLPVIRVVRQATSLGLREARDLVGQPDGVVREAMDLEAATALKALLEEAGAEVTLRPVAEGG